MLNYEFDTKNLVSLVVSSAVGVWYLLKKVGVGGWVGGGRRFIHRCCVRPHRLLTLTVCDVAALDRQQPVWAGVCPQRSGAAPPEQCQHRLHPAGGAVCLRRVLGESIAVFDLFTFASQTLNLNAPH